MNRSLLTIAGTFLLTALPLIAAEQKPNIVMILSDDQAWTDYGFMGHEHIQTPHLDKLVSESVLFRRAYVPTALCRPSLMTLATGRYVHEHGVTGNDPKGDSQGEEGQDLREALISKIDAFDTLPELLAEQGYLSHQSGKWWEGNYTRGGFTHGMTRGYPQRGGRHGDDGLSIGRQGLEPVKKFVEMAHQEDKPFFLWYAPFLPHTPHTPPDRIHDKYKDKGLPASVARYYAMCEWFDETCGELIQLLEDAGERDNTLIVYVCDNGWIQDPNGNHYAPRSKQSANEGGVRTPIFFNWPGKLKAADRPELCSSIDIFPTLLDAAGARAPEGLPGLNLMPAMKSGKQIERDTIYGEGFAHDVADISDPEATLLYRWCIQGKWKLLLTYDGKVGRYNKSHPRKEKRPQLYNLEEDPHEMTNLAGEHPDLVEKLVGLIDAWYPVTNRTCVKEYTEIPEEAGWVDLFDGKTLEGWTQKNGKATYSVVDGTIKGVTEKGSPNSFLCTDKLYGDFELTFDVKVDSRLNSGVQIRSKTHNGPNGRVNGPQVEIEASQEKGGEAGYIYGEACGGWMTPKDKLIAHKHFKDDEWNSYRVLAVGPTIKTWVNGVQISDLTDEEKFASHPEGFIGLQVHGVGDKGPFEVQWRNIRLREITDDQEDSDSSTHAWTPLFDGSNLDHWQETEGNWLITDNKELLIKPRKGEQGWSRYSSYLYTKKQYADFEIELEYNYPAGGNSGLYFWITDLKDPTAHGMEVQILDSSKKKPGTKMSHHDNGGVIRTIGASKNMSKAPGEWQKLRLTAKGSQLKVSLNGEEIVDVDVADVPDMKDRVAKGYIGLQDHGEGNNILFRNIRIREL